MRRRTIFRCVPGGRGLRGGFTLIELLVVISIVALLTAILLPAAGRVRKQARAVACQARLRQWGLVFSAYLVESNNDRSLFRSFLDVGNWYRLVRPYCSDSNDLLLCPMATRYEVNPNNPNLASEPGGGTAPGSKYTTWRRAFHSVEGRAVGGSFYGSYGMNINLGNEWRAYDPRRFACKPLPQETPVLLDCAYYAVWPRSGYDDPPAYEGQLIQPPAMSHLCIDRHERGINSLFWSGAVRKVGLKELWTLKWHPAYDTANRWTKAGGVQPEDWPEWMRGFKDY